MPFTHSIRFGTVAAAVALAAQIASAGPPVRVSVGVRAAPGAAPYYRPAPYYSGSRGGVSIGIGIGGGYGSGLYGPLGYGLGYSPFGYSGLPYGGVGYGALGYGYGYPSTRAGSVPVIGIPVVPSTTPRPYLYIPAQPSVAPGAEPTPLPLPLPDNGGKAEPATITVVTSEGATVVFDDLASEQTGTRHSFTTKPIAPGVETRVLVKVNGSGGPSSVSIRVRSGERATVDMRN